MHKPMALSVQNLVKTYASGLKALDDVSFDVKQGDFFALLGPNGAGKSTTIGILTSLIQKTQGKVFILGHDIDTAFSKAKALLGIVPQEFNCGIFETPLQTLICQAGYYGIPAKAAKPRAISILKQLDLSHKTQVATRYLSGGMKRRLMLARALIHQPHLLILDEPTAGVDIEIRQSIWALLKNINQEGTSIILTTHYLEEAENLCKHVAILNQGQVIAQDSVKHLLEKINMQSFLLDLKQAWPSEDKHIGPFPCTCIDAYILQVDVSKGQSLNELFYHLSQAKIDVLSMRSKTNRLETLFLKLTQKKSQKKEASAAP